MKKDYTFSICIPSYNGGEYIGDCLRSILNQTYQKFDIIISDDCSTDNTAGVIRSFSDRRIRLYRNTRNLGYGDNLKTFRKRVSADIMFMMAQDDLLTADALEKVNRAYQDRHIGAVIRPYYQFDSNPKTPVRHAPPPSDRKDLVISIFADKKIIERVIEASGLLSAISYRMKYMDSDFHSHVFPSHAYPFFSIFKKYPVVFLHDYIVAVRIFSSQARFKSSIYEPSPVGSWIQMFETILPELKYTQVRKNCIDYALRNYVGLVQIRNYGSYKKLIREISTLLRYRWLNILNLKFWFYSLISLLMPRFLLIKLADEYKNKVLSIMLKGRIKIDFN